MKCEANTEKEMRDIKAAKPQSIEELNEYIASLVDRQHGYGTCVYAMSLAATAAFNYVAVKLGVTGFQASCADLDVLRRTRSIKGPFSIINGHDMLYPQYDIQGKISEMLNDWMPWAAEEAKKKLKDASHAHPDVVRHWERLANGEKVF